MVKSITSTLVGAALHDGLIANLDEPMTKYLLRSSEGETVDLRGFWWLFSGMVGGTVLAWLLDWIRSYTNAWIGERISADLAQTRSPFIQLGIESASAGSVADEAILVAKLQIVALDHH